MVLRPLLYMCAGTCPKSYGTNVARLAGLPAHIVARAAHMSAATQGGNASDVGGAAAVPGCDGDGSGSAQMGVDVPAAGDGAVAGMVAVKELRQAVVSCVAAMQAMGTCAVPDAAQLKQLQQCITTARGVIRTL
jgi:DNA mismatch repair protein MSH6